MYNKKKIATLLVIGMAAMFMDERLPEKGI